MSYYIVAWHAHAHRLTRLLLNGWLVDCFVGSWAASHAQDTKEKRVHGKKERICARVKKTCAREEIMCARSPLYCKCSGSDLTYYVGGVDPAFQDVH
jgi:hypothetical protein